MRPHPLKHPALHVARNLLSTACAVTALVLETGIYIAPYVYRGARASIQPLAIVSVIAVPMLLMFQLYAEANWEHRTNFAANLDSLHARMLMREASR